MQKNAISKAEAMERLQDFCSCMTEEELRTLEQHLTLQTYKKNEVIYHEGDRPTLLYCLLSGKVKIFKEGVGGRNQTVRLMRPVEFFGYRAYASGQNFITAAAAFETCTLAQIPLRLLEDLVRHNSELGWFFIKQLATMLGTADERVVSLTQKHIRGRLAESLLFLRDSYGVEEDGSTLSIKLSRQDLANLSNMTTSNAIRTLSSFSSEQLIQIDGRKIKILDEEGLQKISRLG